MSTITAHISRGATRRTLVVAAVCVVALGALASLVSSPRAATAAPRAVHTGSAYGWPVKPFDRQHPVRGFFGDPRIEPKPDGSRFRQFHFGVDVSAPNGAPVYATLTGRASIHPNHHDVVLIDGAGGVEFQYWHIVPTVRTGDYAVAYRTVIGHVESPWLHVHFSELHDGVFRNPLRPGAMGPYADSTRPTVSALELERSGDSAHVAPTNAGGTVDLVAEVADTTPLPIAPPWHDKPVMPVLVRWRVVGAGGPATDWQTAVDFRETIPSASAFTTVYAKWTRQNRPNRRARYRVYLAHGWSCGQLAPGWYRIQVAASDTRGNMTIAEFHVRMAR
jgi:hypothetical protein